MSVAEMKLKAIGQLEKLENENTVQQILSQLEKLVNEETVNRSKKMEHIFEEAVVQYGDVLKKLAE